MMDDSVFEKMKDRSEEFFKLSHHDISHVERVYNLAVRIAKEENADLDVVKAATLLHDIARAMEDEGKIADHATEGAKMARKVLEEVNFPKARARASQPRQTRLEATYTNSLRTLKQRILTLKFTA